MVNRPNGTTLEPQCSDVAHLQRGWRDGWADGWIDGCVLVLIAVFAQSQSPVHYTGHPVAIPAIVYFLNSCMVT